MEQESAADSEPYAFVEQVFDVEFYRRQLAGECVRDEVGHYLAQGWLRGFDPHPEFSTAFYLDRSPDVRLAGVNPYFHYLRWGRLEGRAPSPAALLEPRVESPAEQIVSAALDRDFYLSAHPELVANHVDPVRHYCSFGWRMGWDPSPDFSVRFYLSRSPDVVRADLDPFQHYLTWGKAEGRLPHPKALDEMLEEQAPEERLLSSAFDAEFYRSAHPEVELNHADPLKHFVHFGWRQLFDPTPDFSTAYYLQSNPDVAASGENPFLHYVQEGRRTGRLPHPPVDGRTPFEVVRERFEFDFYRQAYAVSGGDDELVREYLTSGWRAGRDPCPWFSATDYARRYPGAVAAGYEPFHHYLIWGAQQGFAPFSGERSSVQAVPGAKAVESPQLRATLRPALALPDMPAGLLDPDRLNVHWILPDVDAPGRGGHMTALRMVRWLELFGHRCTVWINDADLRRDRDARKDLILTHYPFVRAEIRLLPSQPVFPPDAIVVATSWETAYVARSSRGGAERFYFVQDLESAFYPAGSWALAAEASYDLDMRYICAGAWLRRRLERDDKRWVRHFSLAPDEQFESPQHAPVNAIPRIAFYAREHTSRRAVELGLLALEQLATTGLLFSVEFFGSLTTPQETPFPSRSHGVLDAEALNELFGRCDVGFCLSATNYSLTPLDMMASGLPVVELDGESTRAVYPDEVVSLAEPTVEGLVAALARLLTDPEERRAQALRASAWIGGLSWEAAARSVEAALREGLKHQAPVRSRPPAVAASPPLASVVIPTFNGGALFARVLDAVIGQRAPWPYEIIVVDSSSGDGTWERVLEKGPAVRAWRIPQAEFQHGATRNAAVREARGEYVALLTQDALPADAFWLYNLVEMLRRHPQAAGAFGRHLAWPHASAFTRREIKAHFDRRGAEPLIASRHRDPARYRLGEEAYRRQLHYFSDNNACLRRSVWERRPYPEVDFGEDQIWAAQVIADGYATVYAPLARVWHSHDYDEPSMFERTRIETATFRSAFGYEPQLDDPVELVRSMNAGDRIWAARHGVSEAELEAKLKLNAAEIAGRLAGLREADDNAEAVFGALALSSQA